MKKMLILVVTFSLAACGVETASTAATAAALKKQEVEQGRKTVEQFQQQLDQTAQQRQQALDRAAAGEK